ncbi:DUF6629 family protein [Streptomyces atratus]|uniref:Uncharacterized protein n=1 Tax=Streptomyces atratus TaxID=1893 RepID=A0A1K1Y3B8_STRAR|nr:hypothetical protein SAMN02787144_100475 [Streptomyces atratus]
MYSGVSDNAARCRGCRRAPARDYGTALTLDVPRPGLLVAGYLLARVGALLLSGDRLLRGPGVPAAVGATVCAALWRPESVAVRCAFAAVCSVILRCRTRPDPETDPAT